MKICTYYVLHFKSDFQTEGMDIKPEFVWLMDDKYIEGVKVIAQDEGLLSSMNMG